MAENMSWLRSLREWLRLLPFIGRPCLIVRRYGGLGDLLSLMPGLEALKQKHPAHALILVTSPGLVKIAALAGVAALVLPSTLRGSGWLASVLKPTLDLTPQLADEREPPQPRSRRLLMEEFAGLLKVELKAPQPVRIVPLSESVHAVRARLADAGVSVQKLVVIHTGPSWPVKHWPDSHWCVLVEGLKARGLVVVQAGASGHDGNAQLQMPAVAGAIDWRDRLELPELAALLSQARLFIGIDSGPLHLAASVGVPIVGLFGPTDASSILPPLVEATALHAEELACLGCHHHANGPLHWRSGCPHEMACMKSIDPDMVIRACELRLNPEGARA